MIVGGIDEAGRGPVIGPMVIAITCLEEKDLPKLKEMGVKDSKLLSHRQRENLFEQIKNICKYEIIIVTPKEIDEAVLGENTNLNWLEAEKGAYLINSLKPDKVIIDLPSNNAKAFENYIRKILKYNPEMVLEHKADLNHAIVGAASILAKVTRDREIEKIKAKYGIDIGSGYPADPVTSKFTRENYNKYDFFRKSWATWQTAAGKEKQSKLKF